MPVQSDISDFRFEMQDSSDFKISLINPLQVDAGVIGLEDIRIAGAIHRHTIGADLTHPHTMSPTRAVERHAEEVTFGISLLIEIEQTVAQP